MSGNETPKIEPTLIVTDAPSIASDAPAAEAAKPEAAAPKAEATETEAPKLEAPKVEAKIEDKIEPKIEPTLPPAAQLAQPSTAVITFRKPEPKPEVIAPTSRSTRFALLAACVAIAASFGAIGGSLGVAKFGPMFAPAPPPVVAVTKDNVADEVKALKETVAQLRGTTKSLSDNLAALKTSVNTQNNTQNTQIGKIAETLDRVEKVQTEQRKTAAAAAASAPAHMASTTQAVGSHDITGSINSRPSTAEPNGALKNSIVQGWVLRRVYDGAALIESRDGIIEVEPGSVAPGLGRIEGIKRQDGRWVVMTSRGLVIGR